MRLAQTIKLTEEEAKTLTTWFRGRRTPFRLMRRAKIILMAAEGRENKAIAELSGWVVVTWAGGVKGLPKSDWWD